MTFKTKSLASLAVLTFFAGACSMESDGPQQGFNENPQPAQKVDLSDSQKLLAAEGTWHFVEETPVANPLEKHMSARGQVHPGQIRGHNEYTDRVKDMNVTEDVHFRVLRLERQVAGLQGNFDRLLPPLSNLIVSDEQLDRVISNIQKRQMEIGAENQARIGGAGTVTETAAGQASQPSPSEFQQVPVKQASAPAAMNDISSAASISGGTAQVNRLRLGEHPGKTRMVLDLNGPTQFTTNVDNAENLLLVNLPDTGWSAQMQKNLGAHPLIKSYAASPSGNGGTTLVLELKHPAKVLSSFAMGPKGGHRVVLDLARL